MHAYNYLQQETIRLQCRRVNCSVKPPDVAPVILDFNYKSNNVPAYRPFWQFVTRVYDDTEKRSIYQTVQYISGVRLMCCILSQLNILCSSLVKPYYTKVTIYPLFTVHTLQPFYVIFNLLNFLEVEWAIYNVQYFIRKRHYSPYMCHLFPVHWSSWKQEKFATVHSQRWVSILKELCSIIERRA